MIQDHCHTHLPHHLVPALRQLAHVMCPKEMRYLGLTDAVLDHLELTMDSLPRHVRIALLVGVQSMETGARLWPKARLKPFSALSQELATQYWERWWTSNAEVPAGFAKAIKAFVVMGYYEQPEIKVQLEFLPEVWTAKVASKRLEQWVEAIQNQDALILAPDPVEASRKTVFDHSHTHEDPNSSEEPAHVTRTT